MHGRFDGDGPYGNVEKAERGKRSRARRLSASQAINLMYDRLVEEGGRASFFPPMLSRATRRAGEFDLWITSSQVTSLMHLLSDGGSRALIPRVLEQLRGLRTFVNVHAVGDREVDRMLAAAWKDPKDSLVFESALAMRADAIVTRNQKDFESTVIKVVDCDELFAWVLRDFSLDYDEVAI